jgi:hypothetical protein
MSGTGATHDCYRKAATRTVRPGYTGEHEGRCRPRFGSLAVSTRPLLLDLCECDASGAKGVAFSVDTYWIA